MLPVQRQVIHKLVHQHPGQKADISNTFVQDVDRYRWCDQFMGIFAFDHRADIFEYHITTRTLSQAVCDFLRDQDLLIRGYIGQCRR